MLRSLLFFFATLATGLAFPAWASKEGMLIFSNFSVKASGIDKSGFVQVSGSQSGNGIAALKINVFSREIIFNSQQISQVRGFTANGMQLSYEQGYKKTGGRTLYVVFTQGLMLGVERAVTIEINEEGNVRIMQKAL